MARACEERRWNRVCSPSVLELCVLCTGLPLGLVLSSHHADMFNHFLTEGPACCVFCIEPTDYRAGSAVRDYPQSWESLIKPGKFI